VNRFQPNPDALDRWLIDFASPPPYIEGVRKTEVLLVISTPLMLIPIAITTAQGVRLDQIVIVGIT
jgi:hypothetical protein